MGNYLYQEAIEPRFRRFLRPEFDLINNPSYESLLIRLLTGTLRLTNKLSTDSFDQLKNYSVLGAPKNVVISSKPIRESIEPDSSISKLCRYLKTGRYVNNEFYMHLLEEFLCYFYKKSKASHTTCFVHLYRILEYISYTFPLIYASLSREYYGSFNKIKNYFDSSKSELLFFDEFSKKLLDSSFLQTSLTFSFNTLYPDINHNHFNVIKTILTKDNIDNEAKDVSITTTYQNLIKLTIDLRNRYFHFAVGGQRNIRATEIIENDLFFSIINEELANWLAVIYFQILKEMVDKY